MGVEIFHCVLATVSQLSCTTGPFQRPRPRGTRSSRRRREKRPFAAPACCEATTSAADHRRAHAIGCSKLKRTERRRTDRFCTTIYSYNPTRVRVAPWNEAALGVRTKKRNTSPKACESKICQCHEAAAREGRHQRGSKQRGARHKFSNEKMYKKIEQIHFEAEPKSSNPNDCTISNQILIFDFSPLCFMNVAAPRPRPAAPVTFRTGAARAERP